MWWWTTALAVAQSVPVPDGDVSPPRRSFDASELQLLDELRETYDQELDEADAQLQQLRRQLQERALAQGLVTEEQLRGGSTPLQNEPIAQTSLQDHVRKLNQAPRAQDPSALAALGPVPRTAPGTATPTPGAKSPSSKKTRAVGEQVAPTGGPHAGTSLAGALVFDAPTALQGSDGPEKRTVVPAGSYMKVRILTGVEANSRDELPMLAQVDHALVGPNKTRMDLTGCMVVLQVKGELSTDRVVGSAVELSCVRDSGESVTRPIRGYLAGEDSTFGVTGQLISRQGRVIAAGSVATLAEAAGAAVAAAQETRQVVTNPISTVGQEVANVTGNDVAYVAGSAGSEAAGLIAGWYLDYADQLLPSIAVGSGRDVWVVLLSSVELPPLASSGGR